MTIPYQLSINGTMISDSRVRIRNWTLFIMPIVIGATAMIIFHLLSTWL